MPSPSAISGVLPQEQDLLEAAGWADPKVLAGADANRVHAELEQANRILEIADEVPELERVRGWIEWSCEATGAPPPAPAEEPALEAAEGPVPEPAREAPEASPREVELQLVADGTVDFESDPEVQAMIARAPFAIPIGNRVLAARGISPSEISIAPVLTHADTDLEVRATAAPSQNPVATEPRRRSGRSFVKAESQGTERRGIDTSRVKSLDEAKEGGESSRGAPAPTAGPVNLLRATKESTNRGRKPTSRFYIRGVLHDRPFKVWFGCLIVLLFQVTTALGVMAAPLLILSKNLPATFGWVPRWILVFPLLVPVFGLLYFIVCIGVKCRVCGQKILVPRHCRKNVKAHHVPGLGYILPTALHTLVFRWFNCTFCGTAVRLKE